MLALRAFANLWNSPKGAEGLARNSSAVSSVRLLLEEAFVLICDSDLGALAL